MNKTIIIFILSFLGSTVAHTAGFDCRKATRPIEKVICQDKKINSADEAMTNLHKKMASTLPADQREMLRLEQQDWLAERDSAFKKKGPDILAHQYTKRLAQLETRQKVLASGIFPREGVFRFYHEVEVLDGDKEKPVLVYDEVTFQRKGEATVDFSLNTVHDNGHTCTLEGTAKQEGLSYRWRNEDPDFKNCSVTIRFTKNQLILDHDESTDCTDFCGFRGRIGSHEYGLDRYFPYIELVSR